MKGLEGKAAVVLINVFAVSPEMAAEFLKTWHETCEFMRSAPGFIDTTLHRSLDTDTRFRFVNIAHWESEDAYQAALARQEPGEKHLPIKANPALYTVEAAY